MTIRDSIIGDETLIGIGSVVEEGTIIGDRVLLAASAHTQPGQKLESDWLYAGNPARQLTRLDDAKRAMIKEIVAQYCQYAQDFKARERELLAARADLMSGRAPRPWRAPRAAPR